MQRILTNHQNQFQNLFGLIILALIISYYYIPKSESFQIKTSPKQNKNIVLETNISRLRAAVLMEADLVEINGSLYVAESSLRDLIGTKKAKIYTQEIHKKILSGDRKNTVRLINQLTILPFLKQTEAL